MIGISESVVSVTILFNSPPYLEGIYSASSQQSLTEEMMLLVNLV